MSVRLGAPYPGIQTISFLPNPEFSDSEGMTSQVIKKYTMRGKLFTYVKTKGGRRKLLMRFNLTRDKGMELQAFIRSYYASQIQLIDHLGNIWIGKFTINPFEFSTPGSEEWQVIQLEFEGVKQ